MAVLLETWMHPGVPVESILLASLTVSPQMSKTGLVAPMTPQTRGPTLMPGEGKRGTKLTFIIFGIAFSFSTEVYFKPRQHSLGYFYFNELL